MAQSGAQVANFETLTDEDIAAVLRMLTYRDRQILRLRTGLGDGYIYTNAEIATIFKISPSRAADIFGRARKKFLSCLAEVLPPRPIGSPIVTSVLETAKELTPFLISHLKKSPSDLDLLPPAVFEHLIAEFFASWGYDDVRLVGRVAATSADVFALRKLQPDGIELKVFVEIKRWKDRVGVEVINSVYGAFVQEKKRLGWHMAMIITTSKFKEMRKCTTEALRMDSVHLKDGDDVKAWLAEYSFCENGLWLPRPKKFL